MHSAYILLNIKPNSENEIISEVKKIMKNNGISGYEIQGVYGVYDIVIKVQGSTMAEVSDAVGKIRRINKIVSTITMLVNEEQEI